MNSKNIICWWSGGVTSAVACKIAIDLYGLDACSIIMIDTLNEHPDTYRFKRDCQKWYGKPVVKISAIKSEIDFCAGLNPDYIYIDVGFKYDSIQDVWRRYNSLNVATGAICSTELKRSVREAYQETIEYDHQVFGFEFNKREMNRALSLKKNHKDSKAIFPLLMYGYDKNDCISIVRKAGIEIPESYRLGFNNNNCLNTGCVQGGIGYWQKMKRDFPKKFDKMADIEHELTDKKGSPVTMLKNQGKAAKESGNVLVFLKKHPDYPEFKCIDDMKQMDVKPLMECNGFCGTNDLNPVNETQKEINFQM